MIKATAEFEVNFVQSGLEAHGVEMLEALGKLRIGWGESAWWFFGEEGGQVMGNRGEVVSSLQRAVFEGRGEEVADGGGEEEEEETGRDDEGEAELFHLIDFLEGANFCGYRRGFRS